MWVCLSIPGIAAYGWAQETSTQILQTYMISGSGSGLVFLANLAKSSSGYNTGHTGGFRHSYAHADHIQSDKTGLGSTSIKCFDAFTHSRWQHSDNRTAARFPNTPHRFPAEMNYIPAVFPQQMYPFRQIPTIPIPIQIFITDSRVLQQQLSDCDIY